MCTNNEINLMAMVPVMEGPELNSDSLGERLLQENDRHSEEIYIALMKEQITGSIEEKGYIVHTISLEIETESEEEFGRINSVSMTIAKDVSAVQSSRDVREGEIRIGEVEVVNISSNQIDRNRVEDADVRISEKDLVSIKEMLEREFGVNRGGIIINMV